MPVQHPQQHVLFGAFEQVEVVEQHRPALGSGEQPATLRHGAGERPLPVAEQVIRRQLRVQLPSADLDQPTRPTAQLVQQPGQRGLSAARWSHDGYWVRPPGKARDARHHRYHRGGSGDEADRGRTETGRHGNLHHTDDDNDGRRSILMG